MARKRSDEELLLSLLLVQDNLGLARVFAQVQAILRNRVGQPEKPVRVARGRKAKAGKPAELEYLVYAGGSVLPRKKKPESGIAGTGYVSPGTGFMPPTEAASE